MAFIDVRPLFSARPPPSPEPHTERPPSRLSRQPGRAATGGGSHRVTASQLLIIAQPASRQL